MPSSRSKALLGLVVAFAAMASAQEPQVASPVVDTVSAAAPAAVAPPVADTATTTPAAAVVAPVAAPAGPDTAAAATAPGDPGVDTAAATVAPPANSPFVWLVVRSSAPAGSQVTVDGVDALVDSTGRWVAEVPTDSFRRATGSYDVCLSLGGDRLCTKLRPQGFDTLEIAPLQVVVDSVVETRDTVRTVYEGELDSAAAAAAVGGDVLQNSQAGRKVTIRAKRRPPRVLGQERVTVQTIKRLPGLAEPDVLRAVQALPGVVSSSDFSTKIYVRGSNSDQNLILYDNAVVYSPAHFGGLFSTFLADVTGGLDFYKGGFEPKFGNRLASVLLVSSKIGGSNPYDSLSWIERKVNGWTGAVPADTAAAAANLALPDSARPDTVRTRSSIRLTTFSGTVATDGQVGEWSWAAGSRRTWIGAALEAFRDADLTDFALEYDFYDNQASVAWGRDGDTVRASVYQGEDRLVFTPLTADWGNFNVPVNVRKKLGEGLLFQGTAAYSQFHQTFGFSDIIRLYNSVSTWNLKAGLTWDPVAAHRIDGGYEYNTYDVVFSQKLPFDGQDLREAPGEDLHAAWLQDRWILNPQHTVTAGVRGYWYPELSEAAADPRLSYTWRPNRDWKFDAHWGWYTQYLTSLRFTDQETINEFWYPTRQPMDPTTQALTALGVERSNLTDLNLRVSLEGYYKDIRDVPLFFPNFTNEEIEELDSKGGDFFSNAFARLDGWSSGAELTVAKDEGWWAGSVSYGLSYAVLQQEDYRNSLQSATFEPYYADWDQRNTFKLNAALNWVGPGKDDALTQDRKAVPTWAKIATTVAFPPMAFLWWWAKADYLRSSVQANYNTGLPITDYVGYYRQHEPGMGLDGENAGPPIYEGGNALAVKGVRNNERKRDYFRADITPFDFGRTNRWRVYWTLINVTDRANLFLVNYDTQSNPPKREEFTQFPFLPVFVGWEYEF